MRISFALLLLIFCLSISGIGLISPVSSYDKQGVLSVVNFLGRRPFTSFFYRYWGESAAAADDEDEDVDGDDKQQSIEKQAVNTTSPAYRRQFILNMTAEAWAAYRKHAWGAELLRPLSLANFSGSILATSGGTIVASMSTLWVMGLKEEFEEGREWIANHLNMSAFRGDDDDDCFSQTSILVNHHIGSLLSCYALTEDDFFLKKAVQIDEQFRPSSSKDSDKRGSSWPWKRSSRSVKSNCSERSRQSLLAEWAHQVLEYRYLSALTGDRQYRERLVKLEKEIKQKLEKEKEEDVSGQPRKETDFGIKEANHMMAKVKSFIQTNGRDEPSLEDFLRIFIQLLPNIRTFPELNVTYIIGQVPSSFRHRSTSKYRHYRDCSLGAMFSLAAKAAAVKPPSSSGKQHQPIISHSIARNMADLADRLTESCHTVARQTATGLLPYAFYVEEVKKERLVQEEEGEGSADNEKKRKRKLTFPPSLRSYNLDQELAEAYFTLYRTTRREKWRQYAWELVQAIHRHCRVPVNGNEGTAAYSALVDATKAPSVKRNVQTPVFLGATLKYLYLTFVDEEEGGEESLPLNSWLFNAVGQPLPIAGRNDAYLD